MSKSRRKKVFCLVLPGLAKFFVVEHVKLNPGVVFVVVVVVVVEVVVEVRAAI